MDIVSCQLARSCQGSCQLCDFAHTVALGGIWHTVDCRASTGRPITGLCISRLAPEGLCGLPAPWLFFPSTAFFVYALRLSSIVPKVVRPSVRPGCPASHAPHEVLAVSVLTHLKADWRRTAERTRFRATSHSAPSHTRCETTPDAPCRPSARPSWRRR